MHHCYRSILSALSALIVLAAGSVSAVEPDSPWDTVLSEANGQTVYFNAWGGSERINSYLSWAGRQLESRHNVTLVHVKVGDIAEVVGQLEAAKLVGRDVRGNVDLMWVNGENFAAMKRGELTWGPFAHHLPNSQWVRQTPSVMNDFSVPVDGLESPWGGAQLVFIHDSANVESPPTSAAALLTFVEEGGRFAYPAPPAFHGTTFLKQLVIELAHDTERVKALLAQPVNDRTFQQVTAPLWPYLEQLHPKMRGAGETWLTSGEMMRQLLDDGELDIALSFNPNEASAAVRSGQLPESTRTYVFDIGTIGNTHFVTIPWNARSKAGAMVVADFLLSPEAQLRKADPAYWGDPTVLDIDALSDADQARFQNLDVGEWALPIGEGSVLPEPHASWSEAIENEWIRRFGQ